MKSARFFLFLLPLLLPCQAFCQDSVAVARISAWIQENDPQTDLRYLKRTGNAWIATRILSSENGAGQDAMQVEIWTEHFFRIQTGEWAESRTYINSADCSSMGEVLCLSVEKVREAYRKKFNTPLAGMFTLIRMPEYTWFEAPTMSGQVLYDLEGNYLEERYFDK